MKNGEIRAKAAAAAERGGSSVLSLRSLADDAIYKAIDGARSLAVIESYHPTANPNPFGVVFADVAVDVRTGEVKVEKLVLVHDIGRAINPTTVEGQLQGGISMGLGYALFEDPAIRPAETGSCAATTTTPTASRPRSTCRRSRWCIYEDPAPSGPFGGKGVGMCGVHSIAPAIANAIYHAVGVRMTEVPLTPERVLAALKAKESPCPA